MISAHQLVICFLLVSLVHGEERVEFNRDIRPIFTKHCTACHGGVKEAGQVSFIHRAKALKKGKSGEYPIVPGNPEESDLLRRVRSSDPDEVMPKPKHGPPLEDAEIVLIERWIREGAEWQEHWSFVRPKKTPVFQVSNENWPRKSLDRFILERLDQENLNPSPEASPAEWLRRVSLDLTGLPPSQDEITAFKKDPTSYEAVVDRLLASPRFGERWATVWLDLARYSDTYGFEKDPHRDIWPWRDWVIRAFNADMPYDQFTIEQLAGDLLPDATAEQRLATAFHRNTQTNTEGGTDDEEFRVAAVIDRTNTTWTTWQATTFGCVQCHSHPYDPIDHEEFYKFSAFFDHSKDWDLDHDAPHMKVASDSQKTAEASTLEMRLRALREQLNAPGHHLANSTADWKNFAPDLLTPSHGKLMIAGDGMIRSQGTLPVGAVHKISGPAPAFTALRLRILPESDDPKKWPERGSLVSEFQVSLTDSVGKVTPVEMKEVFVDRFGDLLEPQPTGNVGGFPKLDGIRWFVFVPHTAVAFSAGSRLEIALIQKGQTTGKQATPVRRFNLEFSNDSQWTTLVNAPEHRSAWELYHQLTKQYTAMEGTLVPVMVERPARETRVFTRGNRLTKGDVVTPGVPELLANPASKGPMNRLDMARWLVHPDHPLTARVMVNRLWAELFGSGIVQTAEDFGTSGTPPSHPALLDHLALQFQGDFNWSVKSMLREIVLSSTYRQSHRTTQKLVTRDPSNRLLARGPRNRLAAEMVRDQALAVAGLLSPKMHGPSVFPAQPEGVWRSIYNAAKWNQSTGEDRFRRGIYTYQKRTSGFPSFLTFDAPSRDLCSARRITSNTPLQALVTLNDPSFIEAAQGFAKRMQAHSSELQAQIAFGIELATQQTATPTMLAELQQLHADAMADYQQALAESAKLAESPAAAALVLVANTILNLDSALTR